MQGRFKLINILFTHNDYKVYHVIFMLEVMKLDFGFKLAVNNSPKLVVGDPEQHWSTSNQHVSSCANESTRWRPISTRSDVIVSATFFFFHSRDVNFRRRAARWLSGLFGFWRR